MVARLLSLGVFAAGALALTIWPGNLAAATLVAVLVAAVNQFAIPASQTLLPDLVTDRSHLRRGNTILEYGNSISGMVAPVLAGLFVAALNRPAMLLIGNLIVTVPSIALLYGWRRQDQRVESSRPSREDAWSWRRSVALRTGQIRGLLIATTSVTFAVSSFGVLIPALVAEDGAISTGVAQGAFALGVFLGGPLPVLLRWLSDTTLVTLGLCTAAIGDIGFAVFGSHWLGIAALAVAGAGTMPATVGFRTLFQANVAPDDLGPVMSARLALAQVMRPISLVVAGSVMALADPSVAIMFFAAVLAVAAGMLRSVGVGGGESSGKLEPRATS